jgi:DNA-binding SARP family transcriptional activator/tetratricopeptide (TPR) repeat protein
VKLHLLGPIEAWSGQARVPLGSPQQRCLLAALALDVNHVVSVDRLADIVWSGEPPQSARNALQVSVSRLRRVMDRDDGHPMRLLTRPPGYLLEADPHDIDAHRFSALVAGAREVTDAAQRARLLREALHLWRGEALGDLDGGVRDRLAGALDETRWTATEDRIDADLRQRRHGGELVDELRELVRRRPLRERLAGQYMTALYLDGRRAEALAHFARVEELLGEELGLDAGDDLRELRTAMLRGLPLVDTGDGPSGAKPNDATPRSLPPPVVGFTGRVDELAALDEIRDRAIASGLPAAAALVGTAGVGKTALALQWAHRHAADFPDGQLYLDLQGHGGRRQLKPIQALERLLRMLGVSGADIPAELEERTARLRSTVADRATMIVLDNARSSADVRPLLQASAGSLVLITSRNRLDGLTVREGVRAIAVHRLSERDAHSLLEVVAGPALRRRPVAAHRLAQLCDNLPLALRIAGARLAGGGEQAVDTVIAELSDAQHRLDALSVEGGDSAVLSVMTSSLQAVPPGAARLLRLLGTHPGDEVDADAAAALLGDEPASARRLLELLADEHLVERRAGARFGMHDLIRLFAADQAEREETTDSRRAAVQRLLLWYAHSAHSAETVLNPQLVRLAPDPATRPSNAQSFADSDAAFAWLDAERTNLFAAARYAHAIGLPEEVWLLANALYTYLRRRYFLAEFIELYELGAAAAAGDDAAEAVMAGALGIAYSFARRVGDALDAYARADTLFGQLGDVEQQARVRSNMGCIRMEAGDFDTAEAELIRATALAREAGSLTVEGACLSSHALLEIWRGRPDDAEPYLAAAIRIQSRVDRPYWGPNVHEYYGDLHLRRGNHAAATGYYEQALHAARAIGERVVEARVLSSLAEALVKDGRPEPGRQRMAEARALAGSISGPLAADVEERLAALEPPA